MSSSAFINWQNDRRLRLNSVESHCAAVLALVPPNPMFLDETLRGFVLHLAVGYVLMTTCATARLADQKG